MVQLVGPDPDNAAQDDRGSRGRQGADSLVVESRYPGGKLPRAGLGRQPPAPDKEIHHKKRNQGPAPSERGALGLQPRIPGVNGQRATRISTAKVKAATATTMVMSSMTRENGRAWSLRIAASICAHRR